VADEAPTKPSSLYLLWTIAFLEGFSTLAVEVIAIRLAVPIVGSSMTLTGVMLGVVLFALSVGYWRGGALSASWTPEQIRRALARNLLIASMMYGALAFPWEAPLLEKLLDWNWPLPVAIGGSAIALFLVPIYLASQTVPMLAELTNVDGHAGRASGRVLFFSTVGSVAGGIVTPVWLFPLIGVTHTTSIVCGMLAAAALVVAIRTFGAARSIATTAVAATVVAAVTVLATLASRGNAIYSFDSAYQNISVVENKLENGRVERVMMMGGGRASGVYADNGKSSFEYIRKATEALRVSDAESLLVIGAAGFNLPRDAAKEPRIKIIDAVDVDPAVLPIAEEYFLKERLPERVRFMPLSARYAVRKLARDGRRYGFTVLDAFFGQGIPEELTTVEFFRDVKVISDKVGANLVIDRDLESHFALRVLTGFREVFGAAWITDVKPGDSYFANLLITSFPMPNAEEWKSSTGLKAYTDEFNSAGIDFVAMRWQP
jgi:predicted membrane-bound spermidine synthase